MKKLLLSLFVLAVAVTMASAGVGIQWNTSYWAEDGSGGGFLDNNSGLWQLIYAGANNVADSIQNVNSSWGVGGAGIADDYVTGDDVVWAQRTIAQGGGTAPQDGTAWDTWLSLQSGTPVYENGAWALAGFVFQRVFESATPTDGTMYWETAVLPLDLTYTPGTGGSPMDAYVDSPTGLANDGAVFVANKKVSMVPEPATMSLLGLGALVMAIRRRRS